MVRDVRKQFKFWTIDCAGQEAHSRIKSEIRITTVLSVLNFIITLYASYWYVYPIEGDKEIYYALKFFEEYCPRHKMVLSVVYRATFPLLSYAMIVQAYQVIYTTQHIRFQAILFIEFVLNIGHQTKNLSEEKLFYDTDYQKIVGERFKFCIMRHHEFIAFRRLKLNEMSNLIVGFSILGCLLLFSFGLFVLTGKLHREHFWRFGLGSLAAVCTFGSVIWAGQSIEIESENVVNSLNSVKWYTFDENNKRNYIIMLVNTMQPYKLKFSENFSINYSLGVSIVRAFFSILSVAAKLYFNHV
nr:PREDICTED: uncharacterized protein LOC107397732 [Tribolium castaneum]XP_015834421.1 PREDICTED: uncharacterized protein LOC107397732 [Tribolium castaneum]|eukprot:XP_015834420.1 PREDICTED: uncharacterized protein LOC107397732 [Tribolium castaneum]